MCPTNFFRTMEVKGGAGPAGLRDPVLRGPRFSKITRILAPSPETSTEIHKPVDIMTEQHADEKPAWQKAVIHSHPGWRRGTVKRMVLVFNCLKSLKEKARKKKEKGRSREWTSSKWQFW